jgi:S1-C subfamily serine protease
VFSLVDKATNGNNLQQAREGVAKVGIDFSEIDAALGDDLAVGVYRDAKEKMSIDKIEGLSSKLTISLQDQTKEYPAQLIDFNEEEDLALIKIPNEDRPSNLKAAILKKSKDWKVGDRVVAYGAPRSLPGTLTSGIISHTGRTYWDSPFNDYIQTDTDSNPGNSGGPLINLDGEVIGVMTFGQTPISKKEVVKGSIGLNFAISVNHVIDLIERYSLRGFVHYVSLGLNVEPLRHGGLLVKSIIPFY